MPSLLLAAGLNVKPPKNFIFDVEAVEVPVAVADAVVIGVVAAAAAGAAKFPLLPDKFWPKVKLDAGLAVEFDC